MSRIRSIWPTCFGVILIFIIGLISFGISNIRILDQNNALTEELNSVKNALISTQNELAITNEELTNSQESLFIEVEKVTELNELLETANMTIADFKNTEYELVYMGDFKYTYYCNEPYEHICGYGLGLTASGKPTEVGWTVAADTSVLPMGSIIYLENIGFRKVMDIGGGVKGNHIDILLNTHTECFEQTIVNGGVWVLIQKGS